MKKANLDLSKLRALYEGGLTSTQLAYRFGVGITTMLRALAISGAIMRNKHNSNSIRARGNKGVTSHGYVRVNVALRKRQYEHILIAENILGRALRPLERVHHINGDRADNSHSNLIICTHAYHLALHARMRRHPQWRKS